jgi:hypothetical protein
MEQREWFEGMDEMDERKERDESPCGCART